MSEALGTDAPTSNHRVSGVFAPVSALPSTHGIGDMGPSARSFADLLGDAQQGIWQVLPLTEPGNPANSPYDSHSGFALNRWLISPEDLVSDGFLEQSQVERARPPGLAGSSDPVDYGSMQRWKAPLLDTAADSLLERAATDPKLGARLVQFEADNANWLPDYANFMHLKHLHADDAEPSYSRSTWPLTDRAAATARLPARPTAQMRRLVAEQLIAADQWTRLRDHAASRGVRFMSDIPFYEGDDGVAAWRRPELFEFDAQSNARLVGGTAPEPAFPDGQAWGMPSYRTPANGADRTALLEHFAARIEHEARRVGPGGLIRLDHLLGAAEQYAIDVSGGGQSGYRALFSAPEWRALMDRFPEVSFVGEDLGELTPTRDAFMRELDPPRMRVGLQAFMESWGDVREGSHFADNVGERDVMYSGGTHDYPFLRSYLSDHWHDNGVRQLRDVLAERGYIAGAGSASLDDVARGAMQLSYDSPAGTVITQVFDALGMGGSSELPAHLRAFNSPGAAGGMNWATRIPADTLLPGAARARLVDTLASMARLSRRA